MFLEYLHLSRFHLLFILAVFFGYLLTFIHSITLAHQLPIDISPPIPSKRDKTLWIGGRNKRLQHRLEINLVVVVFL